MSRECDECQLCCEIFGVEELNKGPLTKCEHQCESGCDVYIARPRECMTYQCLWKADESIPDGLRPDKIGVVIDRRKSALGESIAVHQQTPDQWQKEPLWPILQQLCKKHDAWLYAIHGMDRQAIFPSWSTEAHEKFDKMAEDGSIEEILGDLIHLDLET